MTVLADIIVKYILAPLVVQVLAKFVERCESDIVFRAKVKTVFSDLASAKTPEEEDASAAQLQDLIHSG